MQINFRIYDGIGLHFFVLYQTFKEEFSMKKQEVKIVKAAVQRSAKLDQGMKVELGLTDKKEQ